MANSILDIVRRAVRQQTVAVGSVVSNLTGASVGELGVAGLSAKQQWAYASVPGTQLPDLTDFYASWQSHEAPQFQILEPRPETPGSVYFLDSVASVHLVAGGILVASGQLQFTLQVEAGEQSTFAIYVDGVLQRRGTTALDQPILLTAGRHTVEVLLFTPAALITVPASIGIVAEALHVPTPQWDGLRTDFADPVTGATMNRAQYVNDSRVGGVRLLRRQTRPLGPILEVTDLADDRVYSVVISGDVLTVEGVDQFSPGEELFCQSTFLGYIMRATVASGNTRVVLRMAPDQAPALDPLVGLMGYVGSWREVGRSGRTVVGGTTELTDRDVVLAERYDYCLQAWSLFNPAIWSAYSDALTVRAGDTEAPGCFVLRGTPTLRSGLLQFNFHTPGDEDYSGVNVYQSLTRYLRASSASGGQLFFETVVGVEYETNEFEGWKASYNGVSYTVVSSTASYILVDNSSAEPPQPGDVITLTYRTKLVTDFGLPDTDDSIIVAAPTELTTFEFRTFDRSRNEQSDEDLADCPDGLFVFDPSEFGRPQIEITELNAVEQSLFTTPYRDNEGYTIILVGAVDAAGVSDGITIYYRINDGAQQSFPANNLPGYLPAEPDSGVLRSQIGVPYLVQGQGSSRYIALQRSIDITYIQLWAIDSLGNESRIYYFATSAPFVTLPTVEVVTQESAAEATLTLRIKDVRYRVGHSPTGVETPTAWSGVQFATQVGLDAFTAYEPSEPPTEVVTGDPSLRAYSKTVPFTTGAETVRIAYRVTALQANGEIDQIAQGVVPFTRGTTPGYPIVTLTRDGDSTLQLQFQGDSDTSSIQYLVYENVRRAGDNTLEAQRSPGGPWQALPTRAELESLFADRANTSELDGRFVEYDTGVIPAGLVWVAARSSSRPLADLDWPGAVTENNAGLPDFTTKLISEAEQYVAPKVSESFTEYVVAGVPYCRISILVDDPQARMRRGNGVVFRRMPGVNTTTWDPEPIASWYQPAEQSGSTSSQYLYEAVVELFEGQPSRVAYAVIGEDERGLDEVVLAQNLVLCGLGAQPMIPAIVGVVDANGLFAIILTGDSDTTSFKFAATSAATGDPDAYPSLATVRAEGAEAGRVVRTNTLLTLTGDEVVYVTALAYNADGLESEAGYYKAARGEIYIRPEIEELTDETTDRADGIELSYGVLQLRITDPQDRITLVEFSGMSGSDPELWDRTFDGTNYLVQWNAPTTVEVIEPGVERYVYQVPLVADHISRIMYRVKGTRPDATEGILQTGTVTFDIGATPNIVGVGGHIDSVGQYWPTFIGDTDCRSWVLAARIGAPTDSASSYPTITEVKSPLYPLRMVYTGSGSGLRQYPDPDGTPAADYFRDSEGDPVVVPVGKMLFVTAMAFATLSGGALAQEYQSAIYRYSVLRALPYSPPQVEVTTSETGTTATLKLTVLDPQELMVGAGTGVFFRRMAGREASWESAYIPVASSGGSSGTGFEYVSNANLNTDGTKIGYQVKAMQPDGTVGLVTSGVVSFSLSANPGAPVLQSTLDASGVLRLLVYGDSDATHVRAAFSKVAMPNTAAVDAATLVPLVNGQAIVTWGTTVLPSETVYVAARVYNQSVVDTDPSPISQLTQYGADVYVRPTVQESVSETDNSGSLTLTLRDPQQRLRNITFKRQSGTGAFESTTVSVYPSPPATVTHSVTLVSQKTSRIQYELNGIREDGSTGLLGVSTVTYRIGPNPSAPAVSALCSPNGTVTVYVSGDSDMQGVRIAVRKGLVRMTKAEVLGPTPTLARTALGGGRELTWVVPLGDLTLDPGETVSVGAVAYSDAACVGFESDVATFVEAREQLYVFPSVDVVPSETDTVGTLTLNVTDRQLRVTAIEVQTKSGRGSVSSWSAIYTRGVSTAQTFSTNATVGLTEDTVSWIAYRLIGTLPDGTSGTIKNETVPFSIGRIPVVPSITVDVQPDGTVSTTFTGDSDTASFKYGVVSITPSANSAAIQAAVAGLTLGSTVNGRVARLTNVGSTTGGTGLLVVAQAASATGGLGQLSAARGYAIAQPVNQLLGVLTTVARITSVTNTTVTVQVTTSNSGTVALTELSNATLASGATLNTYVASGQSWTFNRHATASGTAVFTGSNVTGYLAGLDSVYIPSLQEVPKPSLYITARVAGTNPATNQVTYGFTVRDPGATGLTFRLQIDAEGLTGFTPVTTNVVADSEYTLAVTQPIAGAQPGLLRATASHTGGNVFPDSTAISVPATSPVKPPQVYVTINPDGSVNTELVGDATTTLFEYAYAKGAGAIPTFPGTPQLASFGRARVSFGGTNYAALGDVVVVAAKAVDALGNASPIAYGMSARDNEAVTGKRLTVLGSEINVVGNFVSPGPTNWYMDNSISLVNGGGGVGGAPVSLSLPIGSRVTRVGVYGSGDVYAKLYTSGASVPTDPRFSSAGVLIQAGGYSGSSVEYVSATINNLVVSPGAYVLYLYFGVGASIDSAWVEYNAPSLVNTL